MNLSSCNRIWSDSAFIRQSCHCDFAAACSYDSTSDAAIGRAAIAAIECGGDAIVAFDQLVDAIAKQLQDGELRRERMSAAIAEVGASLNISPALQARIVGTVRPPAGSAV